MLIALAWIVVAAMGASSVTLGIRSIYQFVRDTNQRVELDLDELRNTYEPIDYWPVDDIEWANANRAVWPMTAGGFE